MSSQWKDLKTPSLTTFNHKLKQYILDIVVHLRLQRFSQQGRSGGIGFMSSNDMMQISISLGILDNLYDELMDHTQKTGDTIDSFLSEKSSINEQNAIDNPNIIVTPDIVKIAARLYFPFKLQLTINSTSNRQRKDYSIAYGSDAEAVDELIDNLKQLDIMNPNKEYVCQYSMERLVVEDVLNHISTSF